MPAMTPELQEAYNEWLLKFGYRVVKLLEIEHEKLNWLKLELWRGNVVIRTESIEYDHITYQLKTLDEIEIYDKNDTKTTRSL
jgi:hypothetical protein